jgi:hypothetical protein
LGQDSLSGMLAGLTPKTLNINGDKATMAWMAEGSTEPVSQFYLIQADNRWVPAGWVPAWEQIREWRRQLRQTSDESFTQQSGEKLKTLAQADRILDSLLATKTAEDFHDALTRELGEQTVAELAVMVRTLGGAKAMPASEIPPPTGIVPQSANDASSVTLIVAGATGPEDEDRIFDALQAALPGDVDVQFERGPKGLKVIAGPVGDWGAFQKQLAFGSITKIDAKQRTLHITLKR